MPWSGLSSTCLCGSARNGLGGEPSDTDKDEEDADGIVLFCNNKGENYNDNAYRPKSGKRHASAWPGRRAPTTGSSEPEPLPPSPHPVRLPTCARTEAMVEGPDHPAPVRVLLGGDPHRHSSRTEQRPVIVPRARRPEGGALLPALHPVESSPNQCLFRRGSAWGAQQGPVVVDCQGCGQEF